MMKSRARLFSLLFASLLARVAEAGPPAAAAAAGSRYLTTDERWMNQRLDHFSPTIVIAVPRIGEDEPPPSWDPVLTPKVMVGKDSPKVSMSSRGSPKFGRMLAMPSSSMKRVSPQSRLAKKTTSSPKVKQRAVWNTYLEKSLVEILHDYKDSRGDNGWNSETWNRMVKEFHTRNKFVSFTKSQIQDKECQLKRDYKMLKAAKQQSGSSWNEKRCMVEGSPAMWNNLEISFPKIKKFRNNKASFLLYDALGELYEGHLAEGKYNCTTLDSIEDEAPLKLLPELEDDTQQHDDDDDVDVVLLEEQRCSREKETEDADVSEVQTNLREQETQANKVLTEKQIRQDAIAKRKQEKEDKKRSKSSRVECMMERYMEMRTKQSEDETALLAREKESSQAADYSIKKCVSLLSKMDVTKEEKVKAYSIFKIPDNREIFVSACEEDLETALSWLGSEIA